MLIITGMSGAGKSRVMAALEDIGYFCVDNLPPRLAPTFADLLKTANPPRNDAAVVMDSRAGGAFLDVFWALDTLKSNGISYKLLYLDCDDEVLERRFKATRRRHPLCSQNQALNLREAITAERKLLESLRLRADIALDTSNLSPTDCKNRIVALFASDPQAGMQIHINSFGFGHHGAPGDSDLVFDVRCLPNPFYEPSIKERTGLDDAIDRYVFSFEVSRALYAKILDMLLFLLPLYRAEGKSSLVVSFGCTGGRHRSVLFARKIGEQIAAQGYAVHVQHRELPRLND